MNKVTSVKAEPTFQCGDRVRHSSLGVGTILHSKSIGSWSEYFVDFDGFCIWITAGSLELVAQPDPPPGIGTGVSI